MTDTDLITAGGSSEDVALPDPVNSNLPEQVPPAASDEPAVAPPAVVAPVAAVAAGERTGSLTGMVLPDLRALANEVGIKGASAMRKSELIAAIREQRGETNGAPAAPAADTASADATAPAEQAAEGNAAPPRARRERRGASRQAGAPEGGADSSEKTDEKAETPDTAEKVDAPAKSEKAEEKGAEQGAGRQNRSGDNAEKNNGGNNADKNNADKNNGGNNANSGGSNANNRNSGGGNNANNRNSGNNNANNNNDDDDDDGDGRQGRRGRRFRDRRRRGDRAGGEGGGGGDRDTELREDDVVQPVAGILDVLDNYAFVRTSGYLAGPNDVYVSMNMVRKNGLRRGDAVTGAVRVAREGEGGGGGSQNPRQKFNPLVRLDTVNGGRVEDAKNRPDFNKLTPLYPNQRLRLETTPERLTTRIIDLIMPIGKGQRALIVSPPKAGKTTILQDIANAITVNNPECHLMVVLVDERPEEVTDMQRSVKGEVIASTFDRPPSDHTQAAELAIERAKRLVEQGKDVVVLLDSITRLGRAYNNASPASGRILSGGVDSTALYPPKRFLGAARNIEFGGSLTIIATAMVETGSTGDTVIFEEFKGTGNAELKLDRKISERRVFPAVDVNPSGTRKDELLLSTDEFGVVHKLRRVLSGLDPHAAIDLLMSQLRKTKTNYEFLMQVSKTTPGNMDHD
ncbi:MULTISPECIES: transcription termination factor Rho [unclassified Mycobacterium]|uniref:transcription termination factor Rho n=1 Tax=unclassified Mycobacterium TaxID=2642494 RepID=UPI0029C98B4D|nr:MULTISPECIES: transcription termination factor Rho [unclassified Mycobacterium]